jgi:hypothetical protein
LNAEEQPRAGAPNAGLCESCRHARPVETPRSRFWLCELSASDARFEKYPRLPVLACEGYERGERPPAPEDETAR